MTASLTSGDFTLDGSGNDLLSMSRFIPDFKALSGDIDVTIQLRDYPGDAKAGSPLGPFTVDSTTTFISTRARGRQVALKLNSSGTNDSWRFGTFRAGIQPSGRRYAIGIKNNRLHNWRRQDFQMAPQQYEQGQLNELIRSLEQTILQLNNSFSNKIPENESERVGWFIS